MLAVSVSSAQVSGAVWDAQVTNAPFSDWVSIGRKVTLFRTTFVNGSIFKLTGVSTVLYWWPYQPKSSSLKFFYLYELWTVGLCGCIEWSFLAEQSLIHLTEWKWM